MSGYIAKTPSASAGAAPVPAKVVKFYEDFYRISDDPSEVAHEDYADQFTNDGTLIMGLKSATGSTSILEMRKGLWSGPVKTRLHTVDRIFSWDKHSNDIMLYGNVRYELKNGKIITVEWAARALLEGVDAEKRVRMKFYQVYMDSAAVANALKD